MPFLKKILLLNFFSKKGGYKKYKNPKIYLTFN